MKILITGHEGFIGQNLMEALSEEHEVDGCDQYDAWPDITPYHWVIHLGANTNTADQNIEKMLHMNYDFSRFVLNECQQKNVNLQYASSAAVYGNYSDFTEDAIKYPLSPYAWSKYLFDRYFEKFAEQGRWNNIIVQGFRYFNVYGPYEDHKNHMASPFHKFTKQAKENKIIEIFEGSEEYFRDFIHVSKVVEYHKQFLKIKESGIWNIGSGECKSFAYIAEKIAEKHNATIKTIPLPENIKPYYQKYSLANITKLQTTLSNAENNS